jgi:hypothetical protein
MCPSPRMQQRHAFPWPMRHLTFMAALLAIMLSACGTNTILTIGSTSTPGTGIPGTSIPDAGISSGGATTTTSNATPHPGGGGPAATATSTTAQPVLQVVNTRYFFSNIAPGAVSPAVDIACPLGYLVASGGPIDTGFGHIIPIQDAPASVTSWRAQIFNGTTVTLQPEFGVNCIKATLGVSLTLRISQRGAGPIAPQSASGIIATTCPAGFVASGGGFTSSSRTFTVANNAPNVSNPSAWLSEVYNFGTSPIFITFQIICLSAPNLHQVAVQKLFQSGSLEGNITYQVNAACPAGYVLGGGGLDSGYADIFAPIDAPIDGNEWSEKIFSDGQGNYEAQVDAACLKLG